MDEGIRAFYDVGDERDRLSTWAWLEFARTKELLRRHLPPAPARVLDVGGGPGAYAVWLAELGYEVHLVDPVPLHVEQAAAAARAARSPFTAAEGDARSLSEDASDYRRRAPARPPLPPDPARGAARGALRSASGRGERRCHGRCGDFAIRVHPRRARTRVAPPPGLPVDRREGPRSGEHRNPTGLPRAFTTSFFHRPEDLAAEVVEGGFSLDALYGIEGPAGWFAPPMPPAEGSAEYERLLWVARAVEEEPALLGGSAHLLAVGRKAE